MLTSPQVELVFSRPLPPPRSPKVGGIRLPVIEKAAPKPEPEPAETAAAGLDPEPVRHVTHPTHAAVLSCGRSRSRPQRSQLSRRRMYARSGRSTVAHAIQAEEPGPEKPAKARAVVYHCESHCMQKPGLFGRLKVSMVCARLPRTPLMHWQKRMQSFNLAPIADNHAAAWSVDEVLRR